MKKINIFLLLLMIPGFFLVSCNKFEEINTDPDAPTKVPSSMLARNLLLEVLRTGGNKYFIYDNLMSKQLAWGEGMESYQYNTFGRSDFSGYTTVLSGVKMVELADEAFKNSYDGLFHFIKAYKIFYTSMEMGDVPYSEALKGESGLETPKYNTQKEVMTGILADLDKAYELFSDGRTFEGDIVFNGNLEKWKKTVTAFQLKVLMFLSKKESDADLNIKAKFAQVVQRGLMTSNADNFQLVFSSKSGQIYPFNNNNTKHDVYGMLSNVMVDHLKSWGDYRLFYYARPSEVKLAAGKQADDWDAYLGVDPSLSGGDIKNIYTSDDFCHFNYRYTDYEPGEPLVRIGYAEQNFILAEAVLRGWIPGNANDYYKKGIEASMNFIADHTPDNVKYHNGRKITPAIIASTITNPAIQLTGTFSTDLEKIITQRYVASFMILPWDAYYDYRRTGYPVLPINPATNQNAVKDKLPIRWMYPDGEYSSNKENVEAAVQRQWGGTEDVNKVMWILE